jgi:hypothetical protein
LIRAEPEGTIQEMGDGDIKWQEVLKDSVHNDSIRATHLRKVPHLKDCPAWNEASFLGRVVYKPQFGNYDGGLVKYAGRLYYINKAQIEALRPWVKWNVNKILNVIEG